MMSVPDSDKMSVSENPSFRIDGINVRLDTDADCLYLEDDTGYFSVPIEHGTDADKAIRWKMNHGVDSEDVVASKYGRPVTRSVVEKSAQIMELVEFPHVDAYTFPPNFPDTCIPTRTDINNWLDENNASPAKRASLDAIKSIDSITHFDAERYNPKYAINILLWAGDELVKLATDTNNGSKWISQNTIRRLLSTQWKLDEAVSEREMGLVYQCIAQNLPTVLVGELSFALARDRVGLVASNARDFGKKEVNDIASARSHVINKFRQLTRDHSSLMWYMMVDKTYMSNFSPDVQSMDASFWADQLAIIAAVHPIDAVLPYFYADIWDADLIIHAAANGIDAETIKSFRRGVIA